MRLRAFHIPRLIPILAVLAAVPAAHAQWGYALADQPAVAAYQPNAAASYNSSNGAIQITKNPNVLGSYRVTFAGLGGGSGIGNVQVTEYELGNAKCGAVLWGLSGNGFSVDVRCFTHSGVPVNAAFTVLVVRGNISAGKQGYVLADQPNNAGYFADPGKFFNSSGGNVQILKNVPGNPGAYRVKFLGLDGSKGLGNVQVTTRGLGNPSCGVLHWFAGIAEVNVDVRCTNQAGAPVAARFAVLLQIGDGIAGVKQAYAWASDPTALVHSPPAQFANGPGAITIYREGVGGYRVQFGNFGNGNEEGNVQVTASRGVNGLFNGEVCKVVSFGGGGLDYWVSLQCVDVTGAPVNTRFSILVEKGM